LESSKRGIASEPEKHGEKGAQTAEIAGEIAVDAAI
jgi:hypothetical protein